MQTYKVFLEISVHLDIESDSLEKALELVEDGVQVKVQPVYFTQVTEPYIKASLVEET